MTLTKEDITTLVEQPEGTCVSIYLPTHTRSRETLQDPIRFKNLIKQAEAQLAEAGIDEEAVKNLLKPAMQLDDYDFWQHQDQGLAIFAGSNFLRYYRVPIPVEELVVVTDRFHLKPLMPLLTGDGQFYILALSQNKVRLLQGTQHTVKELNLGEIPASLAEALQYDDPQKELQLRASTGRSGDAQTGVFHGQGDTGEDAKTDILRFFQAIDRALTDRFTNQQLPLVLAGVDYLLPLYREANSYQTLVEDGIIGNPEALKPEDLHAQAWEIIQPYFEQTQQGEMERFRELDGTGRTAKTIEEIAPAAYYHRIDTLFVPVGQHQWGLFNPTSGEVQPHPEQEPGDEDLMDFAAVHTVLNGGTVYAVEPDRIPNDAPAAAILRF